MNTATHLAGHGHHLAVAVEPLRTLTTLAPLTTATGIPTNTTHANAKQAKSHRDGHLPP